MKALRLYTHTHTHTHTGSLKENKKKNIKGITLVALVVTIVILLILAGISIATLTQTGLFGKAKQAEQKSKDAQELENVTLADYENSIGKYIDGNRENNNTFSSTELLNEPAIISTSTAAIIRNLNFQLKDSIENYKFLIITYGCWDNSTSKLTAYESKTLQVSQIIISDNVYTTIEQREGLNYSFANINFSTNQNIYVGYSGSSNSGRTNMAITSIIGIK